MVEIERRLFRKWTVEGVVKRILSSVQRLILVNECLDLFEFNKVYKYTCK